MQSIACGIGAVWVRLEVPFFPWLVEVIYCHEGGPTESLQSDKHHESNFS